MTPKYKKGKELTNYLDALRLYTSGGVIMWGAPRHYDRIEFIREGIPCIAEEENGYFERVGSAALDYHPHAQYFEAIPEALPAEEDDFAEVDRILSNQSGWDERQRGDLRALFLALCEKRCGRRDGH